MNKNTKIDEQKSSQRFTGNVAEHLYFSLDQRRPVLIEIGRPNAGGIEVFLKSAELPHPVRGFIPNSHKGHTQAPLAGTLTDVLITQVVRRNGKLEFVASLKEIVQIKGAQRICKGDTVNGQIARTVGGGYILDISGENSLLGEADSTATFQGLTAYIPFREVGKIRPEVGETVTATVVSSNPTTGSIQASIKEHKSKAFWASATVGLTVEGTVLNEASSKSFGGFGWFVDLGGVDGLLHRSELERGQVFEPGDKVEVEILDLDFDNNRIALGLANQPPRAARPAEFTERENRGGQNRHRNHFGGGGRGGRAASAGRGRHSSATRFYEERNFQQYLPPTQSLSTLSDAFANAGIRAEDYN
jgi:predicted RNA-binding protein with RPS1 domain